MSHYAKVLNGKVVQVISADADFFNHFVDTSPGSWIQTSYNTRGGIHYGNDGNPDNGQPLRANFAGIGYIYDQINDVFYAPSPFPSWILNKTTYIYEAPVPLPMDGKDYKWNENTKNWDVVVL